MLMHFSTVLSGTYLQFFVSGALTTLGMTLASLLLAVPVALLLTAARASRFRLAAWAGAIYVEYHRSVPLLVQLLVWYFAISELLPASLNEFVNDHGSEVIFAVVSLALYSAAYMSEDLRSGLRAIPAGQLEAAQALGLNFARAMWLVILPQAWRAAVPPLLSQVLVLFKGTSLASAIGVAELTYQARQIETQAFLPFEAFAVATAIYVVGTFSIMYFGSRLSRRLRIAARP